MKTLGLVSSCKEQLTKDPGGLRTSIQYIFAMYLQTGLLGTLEEKASLDFFLRHMKEGSGQTDR